MTGRYYEAGFLSHDIKTVIGAEADYNQSLKKISVNVRKESLTFLLDFLFTKWGFNYLLLMQCREEGDKYRITYVLSSRKISVPVIAETFLLKSVPVFTTVGMIFRCAYGYEREIYSKFGIVFEGNPDTVSYYVKNPLTGGESDE